MRKRFCGAAAAVLLVGALVAAAHAAGQNPAAVGKASRTWTAPRTSDGQPDLQGYWTNATYTPLERPAEFAGKEFFTPDEAARFEQAAIKRFNSQSEEDIHYDNVIWQTEPYAKGLSSLRTSIITDPKDG